MKIVFTNAYSIGERNARGCCSSYTGEKKRKKYGRLFFV